MKTIVSKNTVVNSPELTSTGFTIQQKNLAKIINIVENDIYSDKILAVIREYSCNAYDANVEAGKRDVPIIVSLPSKISSEFKVRDYGNGLTETEIRGVYTSYGESTKENSDDYIGQLGIGSKSGFAYGDNFIVTSWKNGTKTVYNAVKGANVREMVKLYSEPSDEPSGIEVGIPVKSGDANLFETKSINFFKYWQVPPKLIGVAEQRIDKNDDTTIDGGDWKIIGRSNHWSDPKSLAIMGNISYPIRWELILESFNKTKVVDKRIRNIVQFITSNGVIIRFKIGELQMAPSRETLQYTDHTVSNIVKMLNRICDELENIIVSMFAKAKTLWEFKCNINNVFGNYAYGDNYTSKFRNLGSIELLFELVKNKLIFNGNSVLDPNYDGIHMWDANLGKINAKDPAFYNHNTTFNPVLYTYTLSGSDKLHIQITSRRDSHVKITADESNCIMIMDADRKTHVKQCIKWYITSRKVKKLYLLRFGNDAVKNDFFATYDFSGATVVKFSDAFNEFKPMIPKRNSSGKIEGDCVKCGTLNPTDYFSYYRRNTLAMLWQHREEVNLKTKTGYYLDYSNDEFVTLNGEKMHVCRFVATINELHEKNIINLNKIGKIHGFGTMIMNGKKFARNKNNWTNIVSYIETELKNLNKDEYVFYAVMKNRIDARDPNQFYIDKNILGQIVARLSHNSIFTDLYKIMPDLKDDIKKKMSVLETIKINCIQTDQQKKFKLNIENCFNLIAAKYPMLKVLNHVGYENTLNRSVIDEIVNYINFVDNAIVKS